MEERIKKIRQEEFRKGTPLAPVIWEWEELKDRLKQENLSCSDWLSKMVSQLGLISAETEQSEIDAIKTEDELIKMAALCLAWIEQIRKQ